MPKYDLHCTACTTITEITKGMNAPLPPCPACGSDNVVQGPPTGTSFVLKGSGWTGQGNYGREKWRT